MKSIRIQIDMIYEVEDEDLEGVLEHDTTFFRSIEEQFNNWEDNPLEKRIPIKFEFRNHVGHVEQHNNDEDSPMDGTKATED